MLSTRPVSKVKKGCTWVITKDTWRRQETGLLDDSLDNGLKHVLERIHVVLLG